MLLAKRFPREWVERHQSEAMAHAYVVLAARLVTQHIDQPVGFLAVVAYRRAIRMLEVQKRGPQLTSVEKFFHLADESSPSPEQEAIYHELQSRILKAASLLPRKDRELIMLVYFNGLSAKEAGRRLGWSSSSAERHLHAALDRMRPFLSGY
jgi:RNA polymerase sigma factor (sigma-70 family)